MGFFQNCIYHVYTKVRGGRFWPQNEGVLLSYLLSQGKITLIATYNYTNSEISSILYKKNRET